MTYRCFDVEIVDHVGHVRLNRPAELNTRVPEFWQELPEVVDAMSDEGSARALVVSSTGRHFTAGMDLSVFGGDSSLLGGGADGPGEVGRQRSQLRLTAKKLQDSFTALERARMPVLVAIQGEYHGNRSFYSKIF